MSKPIIGVTVGTPINPDKFAGMSAYDLAVKYGFKGTEEEWIKSLPGKSSYDYAVELGFNGTLEEYKAACEEMRVLSIVQATVNLSAKIVDGVLVVSDIESDNADYANYVLLADTQTGRLQRICLSANELTVENDDGKTVYVNEETLDEKISDLEKGCVKRSTTAKIVYGTNALGEETIYYVMAGSTAAGSIVARTSTGTIRAEAPTNDSDCAPKKYVDDAINEIDLSGFATTEDVSALEQDCESLHTEVEGLANDVGDISTALDELHSYAQNIVGGNA